ncbi:COPII coat assembly protein SEC16 [Rhynchospora pubera]|uniref:Protein transport protein sec16 n=1 Tax=Rhynchospora pubera TaxID=906938 RepID=A0AAV8GLC3_9POAL|nr:COPII coat assembly protein SEC16 [Rhynchospora pubera]
MAAQFSAEDQTDEDFFDKLVEDDFSVTESTSVSRTMVRELSNSNLSLDSDAIDTASTSTEVANGLSSISLDDKVSTIEKSEISSLHVSEVVSSNKDAASDRLESSNLILDENKTVVDSPGNEASMEKEVPNAAISGDAILEKKGEALGAGLPGGVSKGTSVKQVQWSSFGSDSAFGTALQPFVQTGFEPYSDVFGGDSGDLNQDFLQNPVGDQFSVHQDTQQFTKQGSGEFQNLNTSLYTGAHNQNESEFFNNSSSGQSQSKAVESAVQTDPNEIQNWENQYPGWKYDYATGTWYQVDNFDPDSNSSTQSGNSNNSINASQENLYLQSEVSYLQQSAQPVLETIAEESSSTVNTVSGTEYPPNMIFDPQYPGWYYDTNTQQWYTLESYIPAEQATTTSGTGQEQVNKELGQNQSQNQAQLGEEMRGDWNSSYASNTVNPDSNQLAESFYSDNSTANNALTGSFYGDQRSTDAFTTSAVTSSYYGNNTNVESFPNNDLSQSFYGNNLNGELSGSFFGSNEGFKVFQPTTTNNAFGVSHNRAHSLDLFGQTGMSRGHKHANSVDGFYGVHNAVNFNQQNFGSTDVGAFSSQFGYNPKEERSSAGRPAHALVTFGFGGKLVIMKDSSSYSTGFDFGNKGGTAGSISILNISEIVKEKYESPNIVHQGALSYFHALCHQSFPGPLVGSNAATKDVNKWLDERIAGCEASDDFQKGKYMKLLLSLLKIMCQHYGKLRSPFGADPSLQDVDGPEMAVAKLFSSAKKDRYGSFTQCIQNFPSESQIRATALEVQNLLVSGKRKEALHLAQEGQLWGPALVLAAQLGDQFYVETVKKMAQRQFVAGSPLRTLCLLIAGQPADVFSPTTSTVPAMATPYGAPNASQTMEVQEGGMLDDWEENLAIITANRTNDDGLVMIHLGDCLWKEKGEVTAAHTCYIVADANFESFSDTSRLCLVGADHWKCPRTFVSPEAIQRTELYEYAKVLGNSQYVLLQFQPYKLVYAHMLAEVGRVSDSLKYCQASLKLLKSSGRAPELEMWKQLFSSLEERIRTHQQGGYSSNAPTKLVKNIFSSLDRSLQRVMGAPAAPQAASSLPPMPPTSGVGGGAFVGANAVTSERDMTSQTVPKFVNSQSAMTMSALMPSASVESISQWANDGNNVTKKSMHNRSVSEPDFARSPKQSGSPDGTKGNVSGSSRLGWIGGALSKTVGWMSKSHRQAKLGDENKFYYDENLKTWVEKGAKAPAEVAPLAPPPTTTAFKTGLPDYGLNNAGIKTESNTTMNGLPESKLASSNSLPETGIAGGMPPIPPTHNQFSARGRMGVRSRYVDTFNKGGAASAAPTNLYHSPASSTVKPPSGAKFFVPAAPAASTDSHETPQFPSVSHSPPSPTEETNPPSTSLTKQQSFSSFTSTSPPPMQNIQSTPSTSSSIHRFPSMDNITPHGNTAPFGSNPGSGSKGPISRTRAASWSGSFDPYSGMSTQMSPPSVHTSFMPNTSSSEELQDIQL